VIGITQKLMVPKIIIGGNVYTPMIFKLEKDLKPYAHIRVRNIISDETYNKDILELLVFFPKDGLFDVVEHDQKHNTLISQFLRDDNNIGFEWNCGHMSMIVDILMRQENMGCTLYSHTNIRDRLIASSYKA
jgi:phosphoribosyl 1,2-cyclic phosphodiesterase